ncbi:transport protein particle component [Delphinella strobiligena]|nr:transport protein particle component [Delphinella strobiligena]
MSGQQALDPDRDKLSASCFDFLLIELVPLAYRIAADMHTKEAALIRQSEHLSLSSNMTNPTTTLNRDEDERREAVFWRLDALGYRVGQGLVERFSANTPRPNQPLDMIKFLCKDLWTLVFRKQIDNLKTNHRGTFVLTDARFPPLARMSVDRGRGPRGLEEALSQSQAVPILTSDRHSQFLWFPCGIIRGALSGFGLNVTVQAETTDLKSAVFQIRTVGSKP